MRTLYMRKYKQRQGKTNLWLTFVQNRLNLRIITVFIKYSFILNLPIIRNLYCPTQVSRSSISRSSILQKNITPRGLRYCP